MFDTIPEGLKDILRNVDKGKLQLPDFQREYVWGDDDVRSLLASIAKAFPVGALLMLETGSEVRFKPRLLAGVPDKLIEPDELLLDGQQRITYLLQPEGKLFQHEQAISNPANDIGVRQNTGVLSEGDRE
jgi:uncharacterized protein with ParB-like and HNH nuclease domain